MRWLFSFLLLLAAVGCSGKRQSPASVPAPAPAPASSSDSSDVAVPPSTSPEAVALPPAPAFDSAETSPEVAAELKLAADSAADEAVLEQLAEAHPAGADAEDEDAAAATEGEKALTNEVTWDIDVETFNSHHRVQYYLDFFQTVGRERMTIWLSRMPRYEPMIRARLQQEGLPGDLVYLALIESGFSNSAVSRARAVGMWQFMKGTARGYGLQIDSWVDERRDPIKATDAAVRFLRDLNRRFGSLYLAAAAYNAGAGRVGRGIRRLPDDENDSIPSDATFFRLYDTRHLHRETKDYVPKLIAAALIAKEPERYGFPRASTPPMEAYDSIVVPDMTGLDVLAKLADTTVAALREINPQYLRLATPPGRKSVVRLPPGRGEPTRIAYAELPASKRITFREHVVTRGQTVSGVALRYGVSQRDLLAANPRIKAKKLRIGQRLIIPVGGVTSTIVARRVSEGDAPVEFHRVRKGETLSGLAKRYDVSQRELRQWNKLGPAGRIRAGQRLRVASRDPIATGASRARADAERARVHKVRRGETLTGLAKRYRVSVQALRKANGLSKAGTLRAGTTLRIPG